MMQYLFSTEGERAIDDALQARALLAFDFDGTLAPIVTEPTQAFPEASIVSLMNTLCERAPVAVITGRSIADVTARLGFTPKYLIGNHGAEGLPNPAEKQHAATLQIWREYFVRHRDQLNETGVRVEDKGRSFSLHFRTAPDLEAALAYVEYVVEALEPKPEVIGGKCVVNLLPQGAPNKFTALNALLDKEGTTTALFIGDDITDDLVFAQAPAHWLTIRVGETDSSKARFVLPEQAQVESLLKRLNSRLRTAADSAAA